MKKLLLLFQIIIFTLNNSLAQDSNYKVVFDMTSKDSTNQQSLIRQLTYIRQASPDAQLQVVIYGQGLDMVKNNSATNTEVARLVKDKGTSIKVCAATLKRYNVNQSELVPGVEIVPDGIYEIVMKQKDGWGYIKVGH